MARWGMRANRRTMMASLLAIGAGAAAYYGLARRGGWNRLRGMMGR